MTIVVECCAARRSLVRRVPRCVVVRELVVVWAGLSGVQVKDEHLSKLAKERRDYGEMCGGRHFHTPCK